ncbi:MAG TPA: sigma-70 family RNA polymerase sigma factor [Thermoleophilaceae bacterium]|nr:sigma-70 family RNA polymerase sigma factor [Thermoleophilaceae bacterium]
MNERLLEDARAGDADAYARLVDRHRAELRAHCARLLGSIDDGEDALQDALLRAWRGLTRFDGKGSLRAWLFRIATNASLDEVGRRPRRAIPTSHDPSDLPDDGSAEPAGRFERRANVELALVAAFEHLPAKQRAALILREVLGYSAQEVAEALRTTTPSVESALQRARNKLDARPLRRSHPAGVDSLADARARATVRACVDAWARDDVAAVAALLAEEASGEPAAA